MSERRIAVVQMMSINQEANDEYGISLAMSWDEDREPELDDFRPESLEMIEEEMRRYEREHGYPLGARHRMTFAHRFDDEEQG